jgi:hypothetical protein
MDGASVEIRTGLVKHNAERGARIQNRGAERSGGRSGRGYGMRNVIAVGPSYGSSFGNRKDYRRVSEVLNRYGRSRLGNPGIGGAGISATRVGTSRIGSTGIGGSSVGTAGISRTGIGSARISGGAQRGKARAFYVAEISAPAFLYEVQGISGTGREVVYLEGIRSGCHGAIIV